MIVILPDKLNKLLFCIFCKAICKNVTFAFIRRHFVYNPYLCPNTNTEIVTQ